MRASITLQPTTSLPGVEEDIFKFTEQLGDYCGSITRCNVTVERRDPNWRGVHVWSVHVDLSVFGENLKVAGNGSARDSTAALRQALQQAFERSRMLLADVAKDHVCMC